MLLEVVTTDNLDKKITRHERRFGIKSFIYKSRRPFHPGRLNDQFLDPFFADTPIDFEDYDFEEEEEGQKKPKKTEEEKHLELEKIQREACEKEKVRTAQLGELLRSKGFLWLATAHNVIGGWQQAGNILRLEAETAWLCELEERWRGTPAEETVLKDMIMENGEQFKYGDRRQELVFIGQNLKHQQIQKILDQCLLTDEEMSLGPGKWKERWEEKYPRLSWICLDLNEEDDQVEEDEEEEEKRKEELTKFLEKLTTTENV